MPTSSANDAAAARALELLAAAERPLLVGHERPDADVLGSQSALADGLARRGARPCVVNPDAPPHGFGFVAPECGFRRDRGGRLPAHDLVVLCDLSELSRTGAMAERIEASSAPKLVVDHHRPPALAWWDAALVDETAAATGVLVARALAELGVALDRRLARALLVALVSDTGFFRYDNTNAEALDLAAACVRAGADTADVFRRLQQDRDPRFPTALGELLRRTEYLLGGRVALVVESRELGLSGIPELGDAALDALRSVGAVQVALHLRELEDGRCKLSARAKAPAEVHGLASALGGGGHARAAGATLSGPLGAARERVLSELHRVHPAPGAPSPS